ncbi:MAG: hypothetical protein A4E57_02870 [Syntrophorhabdaceae bacterium PtaU1.Bin034]|nr:MAG: hypothetical protein A4E57_02870 [Syntrophorhabdaceae bacterium PtaU1.Bin034]
MPGNDVLNYSLKSKVALITIDRPPHNMTSV